MASINSVQQPTKYTAIHSNNGIKEFKDFNFTFVPIPNNEATHDDLTKDISLYNEYYNINNKSFYAEIDTIDHTTPEKLQDSIDNTSLEPVVYAPLSDTTTIIYKVSKGDTEEYKCSRDGVKIISFGDNKLMNKDINASMKNVTIYCTDSSKLCSIDNECDDGENNSVINIKSTGQVKIEIPNGVVVSSAVLSSDDIYLKGTFNSENENTENFFVYNYTKGDEQYCTYNDKIIVPESIISSSGDKSTIQLGNSKVEFTPNKPVYVDFLKVGDTVKTGGLSKDYWEPTDTESKDSKYPVYETDALYVRMDNGDWYALNETDVKYVYDENKIIIEGINPKKGSLDSFWNNDGGEYLQYVTYVQKVSVSDTANSDKKGYYSIKKKKFEEGVNLDKTDSFQQVISDFFNETGNACALDKNFYLVVDTNTNKIIYKDGSATLASLEYNTSSN